MIDREFNNERWEAHQREHALERHAVDLAARLTDRARAIASSDIDRRLTEMNNLREQINAERGAFPSRAEHEQLVNRLTAMETQMAGLIGRISMVAAGAGLLVSITTTVVLKAINL